MMIKSESTKKEKLNLRSEEVQEILTNPPSWIVRWGITMIFIFVSILIALSFLIKYPDFVSAKVLITTEVPTEKIIARSSGQIEHIFVQNGEQIPKNKELAVIENIASFKDVALLMRIIDTLDVNQSYFHFPIEVTSNLSLGDIESAYIDFEKNLLELRLLQELYPFESRLQENKISLAEIRKQLSEQTNQKKILENELKLKQSELNRHSVLYERGVISQQEFESKQLDYLQTEKNRNNIIISLSQMREALSSANQNLKATFIDRELEHARTKKSLLQSYNFLIKAINDWKYKYLMFSSIDGIVSFNEFWAVNQQVKSGDIIFTILPKERESFVGKLTVSSQNAGKISTDQKVLVKLDNYPYQQYGMLVGHVKNISVSPDEQGNYIIYIDFENEMTTSYNLKIDYNQEMLGNAEIITEDLTVAERLFFNIKDLFKY